MTLSFGHFRIEPAERVLRVDGVAVPLGARAFDLLLVLAERRDRVVTKQELLDAVWPGLVVEEHNITTQISTLRKWLGAQAIATVPGRGYRFTAVADAPAPVAGAAARQPLPVPRTRFIGRETALADLARLVPASRLITLTGIGGSGKTRLALEAARHCADHFTDGAWFVDLAPLQDAARVAAACAGALGVSVQGDEPPVARLVEHLAARRVLLVLDNCEHVLAGAAALAEALLDGAPHATLLATSREALAVKGEQLYPVRSLSLPPTDDPPAVLAAESARVFIERARLLVPHFELSAADAPALAEICRRLDGIALAIELAAARVTTLTLAEIAARLDDRFRLLTGGPRSLPRHRTLHAALQWSYELLAPAEQRLLRQMAVCTGGWTLAAAAAVGETGDEYDALALLTALHDKSLVVVDAARAPACAAGAAPAGGARYGMLETVRQFALERLEASGESAAARDRHLAHFVDVAEEADAHVRGPEQDRWMQRFRDEQENLVAALGWCVERAPGAEPAAESATQPALRLAAATGYYWGWNSVDLGYRLTQAVLERDRDRAPTPAREGALRALARMSHFRGRYGEAQGHAQQALAVARQLGDARRIAAALNVVGSAFESLGRLAEALEAKQEALALARQLQDGVLLFTLYNDIGSAKHGSGQLEEAERCYREGLTWARGHGGRVGNVVLLDNLVRLLVARGALDEARGFARECLPLAWGRGSAPTCSTPVSASPHAWGSTRAPRALVGASDRQLRAWGYHHEPVELKHVEALLVASRRALGSAAFDAAEAAGRAAAFEQVMEELARWLGSGPQESR